MSAPGTILIVEDDEAFRAEAVKALRAEGWVVRTAATPRGAAKVLRKGGIDLVLLDLVLADDHDGFEVLELLRTSKATIPVIVTSSYVRRYIRELAEFYPQIKVIVGKPCPPSEIAAQAAAVFANC